MAHLLSDLNLVEDRVSNTLGISPVMGASFVIPDGALSTISEFMLTR